jgi:hypothetical protein
VDSGCMDAIFAGSVSRLHKDGRLDTAVIHGDGTTRAAITSASAATGERVERRLLAEQRLGRTFANQEVIYRVGEFPKTSATAPIRQMLVATARVAPVRSGSYPIPSQTPLSPVCDGLMACAMKAWSQPSLGLLTRQTTALPTTRGPRVESSHERLPRARAHRGSKAATARR